MARWILQNTIIFKTRRLNEGKVIDDAQYDVAQIRLAGGQLTAFGNAEAKKQSDVAIAQQKRGNFDTERAGQPEFGGYMRVGQITVVDPATSGSLTLDPPEPDTAYFATATPSANSGGTPAAGSLTPKAMTKATGSLGITLGAAPSAGVTVVYDVVIVRV